MKKTIGALVLGALLLAGCSDDSGDDVAEVPPTTADISDPLPLADEDATMLEGMGPGISVAEAIASDLDEPLLVNGYVFVYADGRAVMSDAIAESFPPQPAGAQMDLAEFDLMQIPLTEGPGGDIEIVQWTDMPTQLLGQFEDGVFVGTPLASA